MDRVTFSLTGPLSGRFWPRSVGASGGVTLGSTGVRIGAVTFEAGELPERLFATTENAYGVGPWKIEYE